MAKEEFVPITWEVADGYVGGKRPQKATIHVSDLEYCDDEKEVRDLVEETIKNAFEQRVAPDWESSETDKVIAKWKELKAAAT